MIDSDMEKIEAVEYGTIKDIVGHPMSGLYTILFEDNVPSAYIESGYGMRSLAAAFDACPENFRSKVIGQRIAFKTDFLGVMEWFSPDGGEE